MTFAATQTNGITIHALLLVIAVVLFVIGAFDYPYRNRFSLVAAGLAFFALSFLITS